MILGVTSLSPAFGETRQQAAVEQPVAAPVSDAAAEAIDAAHIAEQTGRPVEEVRAEQHRDVLFGQALASLQGVDGFANAGKDATGPGYWVAFTAPVAAAALAPLGELAPDVRTTTDAPLTAVERSTAVAAAAQAVQAELGAESVEASMSEDGTTVTAAAVLPDASASASVDVTSAAQAATDQAEAAVAQATTVPVEVALTDEDPSQEVLSGGTALGIGATQQLACTAGFTVRNARTGATGLITASHCPDNLNYESRQILTFEGHGDSGQLDEQWFSSSEGVHNEFISQKAGSTLIRRKATAVATPFVGMNVCKYGTVTAYGCSQVINGPTTTVNANGVTYANLWQVDGYITEAGDSGGPWYYGNTAYGIHYGDIPRGGASRSAFTSITAIEAATDLRVLR
ncbi:putative serine protease [Clavibacter sepedonicus]|uniref:Serine protease n=1 Tax=Clavibacter sepedonicus TaxID=31964 RepID=B0RHA0_CLASE|nr:putative serine protease [Clavibacter sepedonicus]